MNNYKLYSDGGSRGNPGPAACSCVIFDADNNLFQIDSKFLGIATNNFAEYSGLILGLTIAAKNKISNIDCFLDSELVVKQLNGIYAIKDENIKILASEVFTLEKKFENITFTHVRRENNKIADKLVNIVLDAKLN